MNDKFSGLNPEHCQDGRAYLRERLKEPDFRVAFEAEGVRMQIAQQVLERRKELHLTQKQLAKRINSGQKVISRIERADVSVGVDLLQRVATALGGRVSINMDFEQPA